VPKAPSLIVIYAPPRQVINRVIHHGARPAFKEDAWPPYVKVRAARAADRSPPSRTHPPTHHTTSSSPKQLATDCWQQAPERRPTMEQVIARIDDLLQQVEADQGPSAAAAPAAGEAAAAAAAGAAVLEVGEAAAAVLGEDEPGGAAEERQITRHDWDKGPGGGGRGWGLTPPGATTSEGAWMMGGRRGRDQGAAAAGAASPRQGRAGAAGGSDLIGRGVAGSQGAVDADRAARDLAPLRGWRVTVNTRSPKRVVNG
jgi:hypothetical protein